MPVAKIVMVIAPDRRSSLCTIAIAVRAQTACRIRHAHFTALTCERLMMMRCRRASNALPIAAAISRCATRWPSLSGVRLSVSCSACARKGGVKLSVAL